MNEILIFRYGQLGDFLVALPALWAIREQHQSSRIVLLSVSSDSTFVTPQQILPASGLIDEFWTFESVGAVSLAARIIELTRRIRGRGFDALYYLSPRLREDPRRAHRDIFFFRFIAGISQIFACKGVQPLPRKMVGQYLSDVRSESDSLNDRLESSGIRIADADKQRTDLRLSDSERLAASDWRAKVGLSKPTSRLAVAFGIGGKWSSKKWPEEHFAKLGRRLIEEFSIEPVIFGGVTDLPLAERLVLHWGRGIVSTGDLGVRESAAAMEGMLFYVGNDCGTMHLAAAAGLTCVCIFSSQDWPGRWTPLGSGHVILRHRVPCEACRLAVCDRGLICLRAITVESVIEQCRHLLAMRTAC